MSLPVRSGQEQRFLASSMALASQQTPSFCYRYPSSMYHPLPFDQKEYTNSLSTFLSDLCLLCVEKPGSGAGEGGADRGSERERRCGAGSHHQLQHSVNAQKPLYGAGISFQTKLQVIITNYPSFFLPSYLTISKKVLGSDL